MGDVNYGWWWLWIVAGVDWIDGGSGLWLELTRSMVALIKRENSFDIKRCGFSLIKTVCFDSAIWLGPRLGGNSIVVTTLFNILIFCEKSLNKRATALFNILIFICQVPMNGSNLKERHSSSTGLKQPTRRIY